jgi:hypothetical protein
MTGKIALLFGVHAHQPAGNFPEVVADAHVRCYKPFLDTLSDYPDFTFAAHFSGPLLEDLIARYPADMQRLADMAARGQVEMFGAGDTEPVLASIPHADRVRQIERLSSLLEQRYGCRPDGAWLTERVWESAVVQSLADCGIRYTLVDDYHFFCTGKSAGELKGYYSTEEGGTRLDLFPISEALRYRLPFAPAADAVRYIESLAEAGADHAAIYFDDIEKFGIWPETYQWVYERRWLRDFIEGVLASPVIEVMSFRDYHARARTRGVVYLPTTSYIEMNEWSLPARAAEAYAGLVTEQKNAGHYDDHKGYIRGGIWRNFFTRYPESNWMHKRMLGLSARIAALPAPLRSDALYDHLHLAQANDAYWHGLFGGLYLPHLRRSVYHNLVRLERALDTISPRPAMEKADIDADGHDEWLLRSDTMQAIVRVDGNAAVCEFDDYRIGQNFGDTLRKHPEHYHRKAREHAGGQHKSDGIASAHDRVSFKHDIAPHELDPDTRPRGMFHDAWMNGSAERALDDYHAGIDDLSFDTRIESVHISKRYALAGDRLTVAYRIEAGTSGTFRTTLDIAMPSCDGYAGRYIVGDSIPCGLGQAMNTGPVQEIRIDDRYMGGMVCLRTNRPARHTGSPYHTVSQSEDGFERIMQSVTVSIDWDLSPGDHELTVELSVIPDGSGRFFGS